MRGDDNAVTTILRCLHPSRVLPVLVATSCSLSLIAVVALCWHVLGDSHGERTSPRSASNGNTAPKAQSASSGGARKLGAVPSELDGLRVCARFRAWDNDRTARVDFALEWTDKYALWLFKRIESVYVDFWDAKGRQVGDEVMGRIPIDDAFADKRRGTSQATLHLDVPPNAESLTVQLGAGLGAGPLKFPPRPKRAQP
jgi:hypothetical protein